MSPAARVSDIAADKYVMVTTYKKDGTPVASPLWAAPDGDALVLWTVTDSWKVKRLRRNNNVLVQACDVRGNKTSGPQVAGVGTILDAEGTARVRTLIAKKYGVMGWFSVNASKLFRGKKNTVGISIVDVV
ncbi:MAG: PPOX class F420-dependent oxidoreductase [Gordonia sp. (in: high G+C Gram-positive bacteria)]